MSNARCCVPGCINNKTGVSEILHKFPNPFKNKELFNTWLYSIGGDILQLENDHIFKYRRVCHIHFEEKYWCSSNRLSNNALPTKHMPGLSLSKFRSEHRVMRAIPIPGPSTSTAPLIPPPYLPRADEDVQMKENIEPVMQNKDTDLQIHAKLVEEDAEMKHIIASNIQNKHSEMQLHGDIVMEKAEMKENRDFDTTTFHPVSSPVQPSSIRIIQDALVNIKSGSCNQDSGKSTSHITPKRHLKRIAVTQTEHSLYSKLTKVAVKLSKCRNKIKKQTIKIKALQNLSTNPQFVNTLDNFPSTSKILTLLQFREHRKGNKGRRFTLQEKILALSMLKQSPKGYRFFRKIFILPSRQTLLKLMNMANINPGINKNIMDQIKKSAQKMKKRHKLCVVLFDEMSLKTNLQYNERKDRVSGFVTNGKEIFPEYADHAQVFMIRGLIKNYKQPVAYTFSQSATKGTELAKQLKTVVIELQKAGLIVVATVCDQGTNNVNCIKYLVNETRARLLRNGEEVKENIILINDQEIVPLYDPPHLIKCVRNNLITKNLEFTENGKQKLAKWDHLTLLHKENPSYKGIRCIKKLTDAHCDPSKIPRMKVKFATQVFSQTVASNMGYYADKGILPMEAKDTADLLIFFDKLFDSVNGSYGKGGKTDKSYSKPLLGPAKPNSVHKATWKYSINVLKNMKYINKVSCKKENVPTINNWVWTLEGIQTLLTKLKEKYHITSVWLRHLNQDPIENFFGSIRSHGCRNTNPTPDRFESAYTTLLVNSLSSVHAPGANCELDNCHALTEALITGGCKVDISCDIYIPDITVTPLEEKKDPREIGGLQYVSGYFVKKAKEKIFKGCVQCKIDLISEKEAEYIKYREYSSKKWLCSPTYALLECISILQDINISIIKESLQKPLLKEFIKTIVFTCVDFTFISCEIHRNKVIEFLLNISCRYFIHNYCKEINNILTNRRDCDDDQDLFKYKAKKLFHKCFKRKNK